MYLLAYLVLILVSTTHGKSDRVSPDAQNVCRVAKVGTVIKKIFQIKGEHTYIRSSIKIILFIGLGRTEPQFVVIILVSYLFFRHISLFTTNML